MHPPSDCPRSSTQLALIHVYLQAKHSVDSYRGRQSLAMFTDDMSRMRWVVIVKTKDEAADALNQVIQDVTDPDGICIGKIRCDGEPILTEGVTRWQSQLESRSRLTHHIFSRQFYSRARVWHHCWWYAQPTCRSSSTSWETVG